MKFIYERIVDEPKLKKRRTNSLFHDVIDETISYTIHCRNCISLITFIKLSATVLLTIPVQHSPFLTQWLETKNYVVRNTRSSTNAVFPARRNPSLRFTSGVTRCAAGLNVEYRLYSNFVSNTRPRCIATNLYRRGINQHASTFFTQPNLTVYDYSVDHNVDASHALLYYDSYGNVKNTRAVHCRKYRVFSTTVIITFKY